MSRLRVLRGAIGFLVIVIVLCVASNSAIAELERLTQSEMATVRGAYWACKLKCKDAHQICQPNTTCVSYSDPAYPCAKSRTQVSPLAKECDYNFLPASCQETQWRVCKQWIYYCNPGCYAEDEMCRLPIENCWSCP
ncbi:MAG: hypothetical protein JXA57_12135 [Armatimonadetes bacterium]|nr:hypothetical protein [Armatimonadota bacterium]